MNNVMMQESVIMGRKLWKPSPEQIENANMTRFMKFLKEKQDLDLGTYDELFE